MIPNHNWAWEQVEQHSTIEKDNRDRMDITLSPHIVQKF